MLGQKSTYCHIIILAGASNKTAHFLYDMKYG
jgi:hypothetical protein